MKMLIKRYGRWIHFLSHLSGDEETGDGYCRVMLFLSHLSGDEGYHS